MDVIMLSRKISRSLPLRSRAINGAYEPLDQGGKRLDGATKRHQWRDYEGGGVVKQHDHVCTSPHSGTIHNT